MDANIFIQGLLGGTLFVLIGWAISKVGGKSNEKTIIEFQDGLSEETLSLREKTAILLLLVRIVESDEKMDKQEHILLHGILNALRYNPEEKESKKVEKEMDQYSTEQLSFLLKEIDSSNKKWFVKATIKVIECNGKNFQQKIDFASLIFSNMNIPKESYMEISNQHINKNNQ